MHLSNIICLVFSYVFAIVFGMYIQSSDDGSKFTQIVVSIVFSIILIIGAFN